MAGLREEAMPAHWHFLIPMLRHQSSAADWRAELFIFPHKTGRLMKKLGSGVLCKVKPSLDPRRGLSVVRFTGSDTHQVV